MNETLTWTDFEKVEMRAGTVLHAEPLVGARKPAIKLQIDFGPLGIKQSSAQITQHYTAENLIGTQVIAVVNFPPKQIGKFISECLVLGIYAEDGSVILLRPDKNIINGQQVG